MTDKVVNFTVGMTCGGCSGAVTRILSKIQGMMCHVQKFFGGCTTSINLSMISLYAGVKSVDANVETKNVAVTCEESVITTTLLEALQKWSVSSGKAVALA